jgi:hypothetical protein
MGFSIHTFDYARQARRGCRLRPGFALDELRTSRNLGANLAFTNGPFRKTFTQTVGILCTRRFKSTC